MKDFPLSKCSLIGEDNDYRVIYRDRIYLLNNSRLYKRLIKHIYNGAIGGYLGKARTYALVSR